jgi:hypothetical protein
VIFCCQLIVACSWESGPGAARRPGSSLAASGKRARRRSPASKALAGEATERSVALSEACGVATGPPPFGRVQGVPTPRNQGEGHGSGRAWCAAVRDSSAYGARNVQMVAAGTGQALAGPAICGEGVRWARPFAASAPWRARQLGPPKGLAELCSHCRRDRSPGAAWPMPLRSSRRASVYEAGQMTASDVAPTKDQVDRAFERTRAALNDRSAVEWLHDYYDPDSNYAGATFLTLRPNPAQSVEATDFYAVSLLESASSHAQVARCSTLAGTDGAQRRARGDPSRRRPRHRERRGHRRCEQLVPGGEADPGGTNGSRHLSCVPASGRSSSRSVTASSPTTCSGSGGLPNGLGGLLRADR